MKILLFFVIVFVSLSVNLSDSIIGRMGFDANYLLVALAALVFSGMVARRRLIVMVAAATLAIVANLPEAMVSGYGLDRDYVAAVLIALLATPYVIEWFE
jgi:hypothetical protein